MPDGSWRSAADKGTEREQACYRRGRSPFEVIKKLFSSQLRINMASGVAVTLANSAILAVAYPLYLHFLGYEQYGVWLVLSTVISFAQLGNLGVNQAVMKLVAEEYGRGDIEAVQQYVSSAIAVLAWSGLVVVVIVVLFRMPIIGLFRLSEEDAHTAVWFLPYMAALSVYVFIVQAVNATLSGLGRMDWANYTQAGGRAVAVLISGALLLQGKGIGSLFVGSVLANVFTQLSNLVLIRTIVPIRLFRFDGFDLRCVGRLLTFGAGMFGGSIINMLAIPFNRVLLSRYVGIGSIPVYEIALQATMQIRGLTESALRALVPEVSRTSAATTNTAKQRIAYLHRRTMGLVLSAGLPAYVLTIVSAPFLFHLWLGNQYAQSLPGFFRVMAVGGLASLLAVPAFYILMGTGYVMSCFWGFVLPAVFNAVYLLTLIAVSGGLKLEHVAYSFVGGMTLSSLYLIWKSGRVVVLSAAPAVTGLTLRFGGEQE